jgi:hypothetical protein
MLSWKLSKILALVSVGGGLLFTFISGLYAVKPFVVDAEMIYFGFPLSWFEAARGGLFVIEPWRYYLLWSGFIVDFLLYGSLVAVITCVCFKFRVRYRLERASEPNGSRAKTIFV